MSKNSGVVLDTIEYWAARAVKAETDLKLAMIEVDQLKAEVSKLRGKGTGVVYGFLDD